MQKDYLAIEADADASLLTIKYAFVGIGLILAMFVVGSIFYEILHSLAIPYAWWIAAISGIIVVYGSFLLVARRLAD